MSHRAYSSSGFHHVYNRGARRSNIFESATDRGRFLDELARAVERTNTDCLAYCLMGNHYHLLVRAPDEEISSFVQRFISRYVRRFNEEHGHDGPMFRARFGSTPIEGEAHLVEELRYIHNNPLDIGEHPDSYRWSSHRAYLGLARTPDWLETSRLLSLFGNDRDTYRNFVARCGTLDRR